MELIVLFVRQMFMIMRVLLFPVINSWWSYSLERLYNCFMKKTGLYNYMVLIGFNCLGVLHSFCDKIPLKCIVVQDGQRVFCSLHEIKDQKNTSQTLSCMSHMDLSSAVSWIFCMPQVFNLWVLPASDPGQSYCSCRAVELIQDFRIASGTSSPWLSIFCLSFIDDFCNTEL